MENKISRTKNAIRFSSSFNHNILTLEFIENGNLIVDIDGDEMPILPEHIEALIKFIKEKR